MAVCKDTGERKVGRVIGRVGLEIVAGGEVGRRSESACEWGMRAGGGGGLVDDDETPLKSKIRGLAHPAGPKDASR